MIATQPQCSLIAPIDLACFLLVFFYDYVSYLQTAYPGGG